MASGNEDHNRLYPRHRTLKSGLVILENLSSTLNVIVKDMSEGGAKLKLSQPLLLPDRFMLRIQNAGTQTTETFHCEKRWQRGDTAGISYIQAAAPTTPPPEAEASAQPARRLRLLKPGSTLFQQT